MTLEAGKTYRIDLKGASTGDGILKDPALYGIHNAEGRLIAGTTNADGGAGNNSRVDFTVAESGTYYVAAGADGVDEAAAAIVYGRAGVEGLKLDNLGTYALSVEEYADAL